MAVSKPYYLTVRQFVDGDYAEGGRSQYIKHSRYAQSPLNYIRAFELIQKDLLTLFEYIDPSWRNPNTFSFRTFELLLRTCTEIEANFKSIFRANIYSRVGNLNITDYVKIDATHFLSQYEVKMPYWHGERGRLRQPFKSWLNGTHVLDWYQAYNHAKHDRAKNLKEASFKNLVDAVSGLAVLIAAQYYTNDFSSVDFLIAEGDGDGFETAVGDYFLIKFPENVPTKDRYDFNWQALELEKDPFQKFDYNKL